MNVRWMSIPIAAAMIGGAAQVLAGEPPAVEVLAQRSGCLDCHSADKKGIGPSLRDIAARYKGNARARATLFETVKVGGKGNWAKETGGVPQPPYSAVLSDPEIQRLVDWVLNR